MELAVRSGRAADDLVEDAMAGFLNEITGLRSTPDRRYSEIKSGSVKLIDGEKFFEALRFREDELIDKRQEE
jgi:hypothetical protein